MSADNEFSSGSIEFALKSLIFHQNAVYNFFLLNLQIYSFLRFINIFVRKKWKYNIYAVS